MGVTLKFQSSGTVPGKAGPVQMQGGSLTVGRGDANDLVLPDPDRLLSKNHFVIEDHNGNVVIVDLSTNGTFLNYSKIPLGRTPTPINNGDVLTAGSYELVVEIRDDNAAANVIADPLADPNVSHGLAANAPDPMALLDDAAPGGDFLDDLLGGPDNAPQGPSMLNPVDPIDELLPTDAAGVDEDPFFARPSDGREGEGASLPSHSPSASDAFLTPGAMSSNVIPEDWDDDLLSPASSAPGTPASTSAPTSAPVDPLSVPPAEETDPFAELAGSDPTPGSDEEPIAAVDVNEMPATQIPTPPRRTPPKVDVPRTETPASKPAAPPEVPHPATANTAAPAEEPEPSDGPVNPDLGRTFLEALGADEVRIKDEDLSRTMARMGRVMKTLITGLREILMTRTSIKSEFRIEQTMIGAGGNNPLKFSINPEQAIEAMVRPTTKGYLTPETAAEQALDDIKAHEIAMVTGMEAALKGLLSRLDPKVLTEKIETRGGLGNLLGGKKAKYWDVYEKLYAEISEQAEYDFHELFAREFSRAYKEQLEKLKTKA